MVRQYLKREFPSSESVVISEDHISSDSTDVPIEPDVEMQDLPGSQQTDPFYTKGMKNS